MTLDEIRYRWTIDDVMDAHDVLDLFHDLEVEHANQMYLESRHRRGGRG